jgi:UDP-N-acetylglucosamine 4,6-dehydratase/5-epimerase
MLNLDHKKIFIAGGTGSWGTELTRQILERYNPQEIRIYSRGEIRQWEMKKRFSNNPKLKFIIGDIRDADRTKISMKGTDFVFHLAALKHVPVCEENPNETVLTNIIGTQNVISGAIDNGVDTVVHISTDKAVDPLNLYGITKSCAERLIIAANKEATNTRFVCVRGGNVVGTNGSIVPLARDQILTKGKITLTDERMTRFFLNLHDAIGLIFKSIENSVGGEIFVMKMPAAKITDLFQAMIQELSEGDVPIEKIGIRPGEKIHEVLVSKYDSGRVIDEGEYFIILPLISIPKLDEKYSNREFIEETEYSSEKARMLNLDEMKEMLKKEGWLDKEKSFDSFLEMRRELTIPKGMHWG